MVDLMKYLPLYYKRSTVMKAIMSALGLELDRFITEVEATQNQFFIATTDRDISRHEDDLGIQRIFNLPIESRRGRILTRLRGNGVTTVAALENTINAFICGSVNIIEHPADYAFTVVLVIKKDVAYNSVEIIYAINELKPAHLAHLLNPKFAPLSIYTKNRLQFPLINIHATFSYNDILLNGSHNLDGTWLLKRKMQMTFPAFIAVMKAVNRYKFATNSTAFIIPPIKNKNNKNFIFFDLTATAKNKVNTVHGSFKSTIAVKNDNVGVLKSFETAVKTQNINGLSGFITADSRWNLDGTFTLNGTRSLQQLFYEMEVLVSSAASIM